MAGCVYVVAGSMRFWWGFVISEVIASLSSTGKGDLHMLNNVCCNVMSYATCILIGAIAFWELHLPYRPSLLMSL
jgi:hypothetical protein